MPRLFDMRASHDPTGLVRWTSSGAPDFVGTDSGLDPMDLSSVIVDRVREEVSPIDLGSFTTLTLALAAIVLSSGKVRAEVKGRTEPCVLLRAQNALVRSCFIDFQQVPTTPANVVDVSPLGTATAPTMTVNGAQMPGDGDGAYEIPELTAHLRNCSVHIHADWDVDASTPATDDYIGAGYYEDDHVSGESVVAAAARYTGTFWWVSLLWGADPLAPTITNFGSASIPTMGDGTTTFAGTRAANDENTYAASFTTASGTGGPTAQGGSPIGWTSALPIADNLRPIIYCRSSASGDGMRLKTLEFLHNGVL